MKKKIKIMLFFILGILSESYPVWYITNQPPQYNMIVSPLPVTMFFMVLIPIIAVATLLNILLVWIE